MSTSGPSWFRRHVRLVTGVALGLLVAVIAAESFLLYQQRAVERAARAQSSKLLTTFLQGDTLRMPRAQSVSVRLQNVRFKWSDKVWIDTGNMALRAVPLEGTTVDFDDLGSFVLAMQQSTVLLRPSVLEGMLNESVFNYPESRIRELKVTFAKEDTVYAVRMTGSVNMVAWIPFSMVAFLSVDRTTNTLVMTVDRTKVFGFLPATRLMKLKPFRLEQIIGVPPNKSLMVSGDKIMVKPFGLFPPPRVTGTMSGVTLGADGIRLTFSGAPIAAPESPNPNYVYLRGGSAQFGHFCMMDTDVLLLDQNPRTPFVFSLRNYTELIPRSVIEVHDTKRVRVTMPDA